MKILLVIQILFLAGCAGVINMKNADRYYQAALEAEWASDYEHSKNMYYRSFVNARSASASKEYISATLYGYGRMLGYTCNLPDAEAALKESLVLEREASGLVNANISKRLSELGRLSVGQEKYNEASLYFGEAVPMLEELGMLDSDPIGYADYLVSFSGVLEKIGENEKAVKVVKKAQSIKDKNVGKKAKFVPVGYGNDCETIKKN